MEPGIRPRGAEIDRHPANPAEECPIHLSTSEGGEIDDNVMSNHNSQVYQEYQYCQHL